MIKVKQILIGFFFGLPLLLWAGGSQEFGILMKDCYFSEDMALSGNASLKESGISGVVRNPALLPSVRFAELNASMVSWYEGLQGNNFIGVWPFGGKWGTIGGNILYLGMPADDTVQGAGYLEGNLLTEVIVGLAYGNDILGFFDFITNQAFHDFKESHEFKVGISMNYGHSSLIGLGADILTFNFGLLYRTAIWGMGGRRFLGKNLKVSWFLQNAGFTLWNYSGSGVLNLPIYNTLGVSWDFLRDIRHHFTAYSSFKFQNEEPLLNWSLALEYSYLDTVSFEGGYTIIGQNAGQFSGGMGFKMMLTDWLGVKALFSTIFNHPMGAINDIQVNIVYRPQLMNRKRIKRKAKPVKINREESLTNKEKVIE